jgi:purine-binding chemotaxis protein CheW
LETPWKYYDYSQYDDYCTMVLVNRKDSLTLLKKLNDLSMAVELSGRQIFFKPPAVSILKRNPMMDETKAGKYLTFKLADEDYGISLLKVREIIGMMPITSVPRTPDFVKGVINLRGKVISVTDLRLRFDMAESDYTDRTCIIVVEVVGQDTTVQMGIVVDAVTEVLPVKAEEIEAAPEFGAKVDTQYIRGMANMDGAVKILLDIDRVMTAAEIAELEKAA